MLTLEDLLSQPIDAGMSCTRGWYSIQSTVLCGGNSQNNFMAQVRNVSAGANSQSIGIVPDAHIGKARRSRKYAAFSADRQLGERAIWIYPLESRLKE
jgi:hypothetical protein